MYMCYHAESDHSALKGVCINTKRTIVYGALESVAVLWRLRSYYY